ncbi:calmodulin-binding protein 60 B-like [Silene latifolia]|uniref:calmodulin-binding protein 60 B-like n=1 Tax=Silene latifolia TaxID=37657 RepID=UPI003D76B70A
MVFKRQFGEEGNDESPPSKFHKVVKYVMKETYLQEIADKIAIRLEHTFRKVLKEELEQHIAACNQSSPSRSLVYQPESLPSRGFKLQFVKKLPSTLFTNTRIGDEEHAPLQVHLIDANSNNGIYHGKLSSIKLEIVVLNGDFLANGRENWTESEFNDNIVRQREGKRPLLIGELSVVLVNGVGSLGHVCFTDNSSWIRSRKFKLGVRAMASGSVGTGIKEAVSEAFVVLDHRGESYQKHNTPSLEDPVWRLKKIAKLGASHNKLVSHGITTVKDFLTHYNMNPSSLRRVLGKGVPTKAWDTMVKHANECHLDDMYYRFSDESNCVDLIFNCVYKVIAVKFSGQDYQPADSLDTHHKALVEELKQSALMRQNELVPFHGTSAISPLELPTTGHNSLISSSRLDLHHDDFSTIDQDKQVNQMDFNLLDTASYPYTAEGCSYLPEDDSTSRTDPPVPVNEFSPSTFMTGNSYSAPSDGVSNWYLNSPGTTYAQNINPFGQLLHPQTATWGQDNDLFSLLPPVTPYGIPYQIPEYGVNVSGNGSPRARWCKLRAAVMWKIVRRNAAARRKGKFPRN